tara:strand:+ start:3255 stop:3563 length:309 start_codon:yes stop_codon:yes gene_type:complete
MSPRETVSLDLLARQGEELLAEVRGMREDSREILVIVAGMLRSMARQEQSLDNLSDDLRSILRRALDTAIADHEASLATTTQQRYIHAETALSASPTAPKAD